ncbi:MAG: multiheme c-type cytochrome [Pseudomonadota bacterium]
MTGQAAAALLGCALAVGGWAPLAAETPGLPEHPYWERPIPLQGEAPPAPPGAEAIADLSAASCGQCHPAQWEAWRTSLHAAATSPGLLGQLGNFDDGTQEDCLECHAPRQEMLDRWWEQGPDSKRVRSGVDCASCHVRAHVRHGPRAIAETPHGPVREQPLFRRAEFCAPCHQFDQTGLSVNGKPLENTYVEWRQSRYAREGVTCQACHMPEKHHGFRGIHDPGITRCGLSVQGLRTRQGLRVRAGNTGAGHALPTYVTPRIRLRLEGVDGGPVREHVIARKMRWSREEGWVELADDRLFPDQWVSVDLAIPPDRAGRISVRVEPDYDYHERVYPALLAMLADDLTEEERALLERARKQSGRTAYLLYRMDCPGWNGHDEPCHETP